MATISKVRRLVNPGKRRLSPLQKLFFGSKRQRAAVKRNAAIGYRGSTPKPTRRISATSRVYFKKRNSGSTSRARTVFHKTRSHASHVKLAHKIKMSARRRYAREDRQRNVGSIITVFPKRNPAKRKRRIVPSGGYTKSGYVKSAWPKRRVNRGSKRVIIVNKGATMATRRRRRRNYGTVFGRSWSRSSSGTSQAKKRAKTAKKRKTGRKGNPGRRRVASYRRRRNPGTYSRRRRVMHRRHHRRNPGILTGTAGRVLGVVGGVAVTKFLCGFLPAQLGSGVLGYLSTAAVAVLQGKVVSKVSKNPALGNDMMIGGLAYLAAKVLNDFFPAFGAYTGISGMGIIGSSSFYNPQVNINGNMGRFVVPAAVSGYVNASMPVAKGVGSLRRTGRLM